MEGNMTRAGISYQSEVTEECIAEHRLWMAVITLAVEDWRSGTLRARREAQKFLFDNENEYSRACAGAGLDPTSLRSKLLKIGQKIEMQGPWTHPLAA
ncbi:MAG TPA: hypothetical protein VN822_13330 [Candidatus Acidoferrales bacterium]|nr:hypothetical protein [Candidatus Acidoferrales bacterium]